nr:hypothetical protein [Tanacetum cinerariifolium]
MAWLDYDEHVDSLSTMNSEVEVTSPKSTTQTLPSFEEYTPLVAYPKEVEKNLGTPIEVEPLNETKLKEVGLNCNHNTPFSYRKVPSFDGPKPQSLLNGPSLDVSLGDVIGPKPPIKPHSPDSSRMKVVDYLTTQTPPSPHVGLESKEVSPIEEELSLFDRPNEVERGRKSHLLEDKQIPSVGVFDRKRKSHHAFIPKIGLLFIAINSGYRTVVFGSCRCHAGLVTASQSGMDAVMDGFMCIANSRSIAA